VTVHMIQFNRITIASYRTSMDAYGMSIGLDIRRLFIRCLSLYRLSMKLCRIFVVVP